MRIEKRYYDLMQSEWNEITEEVRAQEASRTEAEQAAEAQKTKQELQEIYRKHEEHTQKWKKVSDKKRMRQFDKLSKQALWMAAFLGNNIIIEDDGGSLGKITMEADTFTLPSLGDRIINKTLSEIILLADDVFISSTPSGLCQLEFWFHLYKEIRVKRTSE